MVRLCWKELQEERIPDKECREIEEERSRSLLWEGSSSDEYLSLVCLDSYRNASLNEEWL
jgi:hypothetical protein